MTEQDTPQRPEWLWSKSPLDDKYEFRGPDNDEERAYIEHIEAEIERLTAESDVPPEMKGPWQEQVVLPPPTEEPEKERE